MKINITIWEINMDGSSVILKEEVATGPMEPYILEREEINWN
jgi:hypothetical protein